ncbi:MAG: TPM domain-containing protein [Ruminococcus sp.]|nr:TPM domain-containing protein [Ruminococcus sp.]
MKKFYEFFTAVVIMSVFLSGCVSSPQNTPPDTSENIEISDDTVQEENPSGAEEITHAPQDNSGDTLVNNSEDTGGEDEVQSVKAESGKYIYDYANILSDEDKNEIETYIKRISAEKMINAAVVTISSGGGSTSADYAKDIFNQLYDNSGNGLVFVLNNDTKYDYLLKTGVCDLMIDTNDLNSALFSATEMFVSGEYKDGIMHMLSLADICPSHIFDELGVYSVEELQFIENRLSGSNRDISVILTSNVSDYSDYDLCKIWHDRRYPDGGGYMILLNTALQQSAVYTDNEITGNLAAAFETASAYLYAQEYYLAMDTIINYIDY